MTKSPQNSCRLGRECPFLILPDPSAQNSLLLCSKDIWMSQLKRALVFCRARERIPPFLHDFLTPLPACTFCAALARSFQGPKTSSSSKRHPENCISFLSSIWMFWCCFFCFWPWLRASFATYSSPGKVSQFKIGLAKMKGKRKNVYFDVFQPTDHSTVDWCTPIDQKSRGLSRDIFFVQFTKEFSNQFSKILEKVSQFKN